MSHHFKTSGFFYNQYTCVCYRTLDFLDFAGYRIGTDGSAWGRKDNSGKLTNTWRLLAPHKDKRSGHLRITLWKNNTAKRFFIHQLVLLAFVGPCPENAECRHFPDRNPENNNVENLRWGTRQQNQSDKIYHGTSPRGEKSGAAKLTEEDVINIRKVYATGDYTYAELAKFYGVDFTNIYSIVKRKSWKHI